MIHMVLLAIGVIWVIQVIPLEEKTVDFTPKSGGGGTPASTAIAQKQRVQMIQPSMSRIAADGAMSDITLPEPAEINQMTSLGGLSSMALASGLSGAGSGGGKGDGFDKDFGSGLTPGMSSGNGSNNLFGMIETTTGGLAGSFYDFKQSARNKPTGMTDDGVRKELKEIVKRGLKDRDFASYFKAPRTLYQTKFLIPSMQAELAPAAFEVEKYVEPRRWGVVYRGAVRAPRSGKFRFVGAGDDVLVVRFNNKLVFDYGYTHATGGQRDVASVEKYNADKNSEAIRNYKRTSPMPVPTLTYKYASTPIINSALGGFAVGPDIQVTEGLTYPIEILISEIPGGIFSTVLMIEEEGVTYQKDSTGSPILPLFRLDHSQPDPALKGQSPPIDPNSPVWKLVPDGRKRDF